MAESRMSVNVSNVFIYNFAGIKLQVQAISQQKVAAREPIALNCHQSNNQLLTLLHQRHGQCSTATCAPMHQLHRAHTQVTQQ